MNEIEKKVRELEFGEGVKLANGNTVTRVIGGWVYATSMRNVCFFPEPKESGLEAKIVTKARTREAKK